MDAIILSAPQGQKTDPSTAIVRGIPALADNETAFSTPFNQTVALSLVYNPNTPPTHAGALLNVRVINSDGTPVLIGKDPFTIVLGLSTDLSNIDPNDIQGSLNTELGQLVYNLLTDPANGYFNYFLQAQTHFIMFGD